jgi:uracil-DNA glycosylase
MAAKKSNELIPILLNRLEEKYPNARYELDWTTPLEMLVATILAAQCTDVRVNQVTKTLFKKYTTAKDYMNADTAALEQDIKATGTYKQKAKAIQGACKVLVERFNGDVPQTMEELLTLPGVARKTANVVLNNVWNIPSGIIVDTHVNRTSQRMGLSKNDKPDAIEKDLMPMVPKDRWTFFGPAMVLHGRYTCTAKNPKCGECMFNDVCPKLNLDGATGGGDEEEDEAPKAAAPKAAAKAAAPREAATKAAPPEQAALDFTPGPPASGLVVPASWQASLGPELKKPYFTELMKFLEQERATKQIFPPENEVFSALELTPYENVNVLLLGQDPYHDDGQAHGLCFSVKPGIKAPPSLVNMYKELKTDLGCKIPNNGYLVPWARQGMLMINAVLTVQAHTPNSHKDRGWEQFTDAIIRKVNERPHVVFLLWGSYAQKKSKLIDARRHTILNCAHPSPLSATKFFGSKPFSRTNAALKAHGQPEIDWQIPDL